MAKQVLFWPGMSKSISDMCNLCEQCAKYQHAAPKEPMKSLPIPSLPWQIVSQDIFELDRKSKPPPQRKGRPWIYGKIID
jgi:hypothetical protein